MTATAIAFLAVLAGALACLFIAGWRRILKADRPLPLGEMMLRHGAHLPQVGNLAGRELGRAVRRCLSCGSAERCRTWLAEDRNQGYEAFCPNAGFIEELKRIRL